jgi:hypothetical protein
VDFQLAFDFTFSKDSEHVDAAFTGERAGSYDVDQQGSLSGAFPGGMKFQGQGAGNESFLDTLVPATYPYMAQSVQIKLQPDAVMRFMDKFKAAADGEEDGRTAGFPMGYGSSKAEIQESLDKFPTVNVTWDLVSIGGSSNKQEFALEPGTLTTLEATVEIVPYYVLDFVDSIESIQQWSVKTTSQAVSSRKLDVSQSTQAQVRYVISVEPAARAIEVKYAYSVNDFLLDAGALAGMLGVGCALLTATHRAEKYLAKWLKQPWINESDPVENAPKGERAMSRKHGVEEGKVEQTAMLEMLMAKVEQLERREYTRTAGLAAGPAAGLVAPGEKATFGVKITNV